MGAWRDFVDKSKRKDLPRYPEQVYLNKGWINCFEFLGTKRNFLSYDKCKEYIHLLNIQSKTKYYEWAKSNRPNNTPGDPYDYYRNKGWVSWQDFLGY